MSDTQYRRRGWRHSATLICVLAVCLTITAASFAIRDVAGPRSGEGGRNFSAIGFFSASNHVVVHETPAPEEKPSEILGPVKKILEKQEAAWNRGDLEGFMEGYWKSPKLTFYSGRDKKAGWDETYQRYKDRYQKDGREMGTVTFSEVEYDIVAADTVVVRGRWALKLKESAPDGLFTLIVRKKPEGWRIVHDQTSVGETKKSP